MQIGAKKVYNYKKRPPQSHKTMAFPIDFQSQGFDPFIETLEPTVV